MLVKVTIIDDLQIDGLRLLRPPLATQPLCCYRFFFLLFLVPTPFPFPDPRTPPRRRRRRTTITAALTELLADFGELTPEKAFSLRALRRNTGGWVGGWVGLVQ